MSNIYVYNPMFQRCKHPVNAIPKDTNPSQYFHFLERKIKIPLDMPPSSILSSSLAAIWAQIYLA